MNTSDTIAAKGAHPGETLRLAREARGWSITDVATRLNLKENALAKLEAGDFSALPGMTFARGYIRAYAKLLGLDQQALVSDFDRHTGTDATSGSEVHALERIDPQPLRLSFNMVRIVLVVVLLAILGSLLFWWTEQQWDSPSSAERLGLEIEVETSDGQTQVHVLDEPEDLAVDDAQQQAEAPVVLADESASSVSAEQPAVAAQAPAAVAGDTPPTAPAPAAVADNAAVAAAGVPALSLSFSADCWTQVRDASGKVLLSALKKKGETVELSGKPPFSLTLGYVAGVELKYNGQPVDLSAYTRGQTARLQVGE